MSQQPKPLKTVLWCVVRSVEDAGARADNGDVSCLVPVRA